MSEMNFPDPSPSQRKPIPWKIILPVALVLILCCGAIFTAGVLMYLGTEGIGPLASLANSPLFSSSSDVLGDWDLYYDWTCSGSYFGPATISFQAGGGYIAYEEGEEARGTWFVQGNIIDFTYDPYPNAHYTGTIVSSEERMEGTMSTADGSQGCWYAVGR